MENNTPGTEDSYKQYGRISFEDFKKLYGEDYIDAINIETWKIRLKRNSLRQNVMSLNRIR